MCVMGTMPYYILAVLFTLLMGFVYFFARLFLKLISRLTEVVSDLKSFSMGIPPGLIEDRPSSEFVEPDIPDEDFGSAVLTEEELEKREEEDF